MKKATTIMAIPFFVLVAPPQEQSKNKPQQEQTVIKEEAEKIKAAQKAEAEKNELDPNTRSHLHRVRNSIYNVGKPDPAKEGKGC